MPLQYLPLGFTVFSGMLPATSMAIFVVPVLFMVISRIAGIGKGVKAGASTKH